MKILPSTAAPGEGKIGGMKTASFQKPLGGGKVQCLLCPHGCVLAEGGTGRCRVRKVLGGTLRALAADKVVALHLDPVEKKPLYHVFPGAPVLSFATVGCNLSCRFCQNASISQFRGDPPPGDPLSAEEIVERAHTNRCPAVAATYTEPTVFFELAREVGLAARARGILNLWVTNGFISTQAGADLAGWLDGANVDLKSMRDETYREYCGGRLAPVLETIEGLHRRGVWVEVTTLVIPGMNDSPEELREAARFLASLSPDIPWHVTAFHPDFRMLDRGPTPAGKLIEAVEIGREEGLRFVYPGNVRIRGGGDTLCPSCGDVVIRRSGFALEANRLRGGACPGCGTKIAGIWEMAAG